MDEYEHFDKSIFYTDSNIPGPGVDISLFEEEFSQGCQCNDNCISLCSCGSNYQLGKLKQFSSGIYECNSYCACKRERTCPNRIVSLGPRKNLKIIQTPKGFGLTTKSLINQGEFICEYAGEVIGIQEAERRFGEQEIKKSSNYIFILNEYFGKKLLQTIIDPSIIGNIGRYINHSCDPNCIVIPVRTCIQVPKLAIFAKKDIMELEEITFDYGSESNIKLTQNKQVNLIKCLCNSINCRKYLPFAGVLKTSLGKP